MMRVIERRIVVMLTFYVVILLALLSGLPEVNPFGILIFWTILWGAIFIYGEVRRSK